jgi:hypothetical protein
MKTGEREMRRYARLLTTMLLLGASASLALSDTLASATAGLQETVTTYYFGQAFTTVSTGGPWNNITFNFYAFGTTTPLAAGTAFLLNQQYLGTPNALSSSTPGYLDSTSTIINGTYMFDSALVLQTNTQYWLYENVLIQPYLGLNNAGTYYAANAGTNAFTISQHSTNYLVTGTTRSIVPPATPAPSTLLLMLIGLGCAVPYAARNRWQRKT